MNDGAPPPGWLDACAARIRELLPASEHRHIDPAFAAEWAEDVWLDRTSDDPIKAADDAVTGTG